MHALDPQTVEDRRQSGSRLATWSLDIPTDLVERCDRSRDEWSVRRVAPLREQAGRLFFVPGLGGLAGKRPTAGWCRWRPSSVASGSGARPFLLTVGPGDSCSSGGALSSLGQLKGNGSGVARRSPAPWPGLVTFCVGRRSHGSFARRCRLHSRGWRGGQSSRSATPAVRLDNSNGGV